MILEISSYRRFLGPLKSVLLAAALLGCSGSTPGGPEGPQGDPTPEDSGPVNDLAQLTKPYVVMVSLDGFRYDYLDLFPTPNLHRIIDAGVRADAMIPVFPVKTFPNHYSIATGMYADSHGIVGNSFYDPLRDEWYSIGDRASVEDGTWYGGEPIWVTAVNQGMLSASYYWVGSEAAIGGVYPTYWRRFDGDVPYEERIDQVLSWLDLPEEKRPHMITAYMEETDGVGHGVPTEAPELATAVALVDSMIGRLLDGIDQLPHADQVYVVVTSDHGMAAFYADQTYFLGDLVSLGENVTTVGTGPHMVLYVDDEPAVADALREELAAVLPKATVYRVGDMPERLQYETAGPRLGDIVIVPELGWSVVPWKEETRAARDGWTHGWDRNNEEMYGLFVASGPRIQAGQRIGSFENVNVYPLLAEILGLVPNPEADGRLEVLGSILGN
jgi:arylsulfatase A-like enzyme